MELKQYFTAIRKWWWLVVASTLVATLSGYIGVSRMPRIYQASTTVMVGQGLETANPNSQDLYISQQLAQTYREMATRQPVLRGAAESLGLPYVPSDDDVSAWLVPGTQLMGIAVSDTDPERARALADAIVQQLILVTPSEIAEDQARQDFVRTQLRQLETNIQATEAEILAEQARLDAADSARAIQQYQSNISALQAKLSSYQATYGSLLGSVEGRTNYISVFEPASTPTRPISPNVMMTVLTAAAVGMALAVGGALLIEFLDDTVKVPEDVTRGTNLPVLGSIGRMQNGTTADQLITVRRPLSIISEAYRAVRTNVRVSSVDNPLRTIVITSPQPGEGKTTLAANLGVVMAQAGNRVVVVDTDLRHAMLHMRFDLPNRGGLTDALMADEPPLDSLLQQTEVENLRVLTSGPLPPNASELLGSQKMRRLIARLKDEADIILFDTPPALLVTDAAVLAMETDGVLLLAESGRTRRAALRQAIERLQPLGVNIVGVVLNGIPTPRAKGYYYYQHFGEQDQEEQKGGVAPGGDARQMPPTAEPDVVERLRLLGARVLEEVPDRVPFGRREGSYPPPPTLRDDGE
jgi:succinoglycan biosynthesis transport protein ExoP